jgi:hypothetical protein
MASAPSHGFTAIVIATPKRRPRGPPPPTPYDGFLYLLSEIEHAVSLGQIEWSPDRIESVLRRLANVTQAVARARTP